MTELVIGKPVQRGRRIGKRFLELMQSKGSGEPDEDVLEDAVAFAGVSKYPARIKCALLGWMALEDALSGGVAGRAAMPEREHADDRDSNAGRGHRRRRTSPTSRRRCVTSSTPSSGSTSSTWA